MLGGEKLKNPTVENSSHNSLFFKDFMYLFLERGVGREKERERNISVWLPFAYPLLGTWTATQACAQTGNRTGDPLVHRPTLNPLSHTILGQITVLRLLPLYTQLARLAVT